MSFTIRRRDTILAVMLVTLLGAAAGVPAVDAAQPQALGITVLSNRADLISGGDALVEVVLPSAVAPGTVRVTVNGRDVSDAFAVRADGRFAGVIDGLALGANEVIAVVAPGPGSKGTRATAPARLVITNHSKGGPVFSGAQLQPWICARKVATSVSVTVPGTSLSAMATSRASGLDGPDPANPNEPDAECNATTLYTFFYQPKEKEGTACTFTTPSATSCLIAYDPLAPPAAADIANFTNDRGDTVKSIVRVERGTMNRGMYQLATFFDPTKPNAPWAPQQGWNGKVLWLFGASASASRFQTAVNTATVLNDVALRQGFMVASSSLTDNGTNANHTLAAETLMMVKERVAETYGPIRYTIGAGCSGGSIMQAVISGTYPGLLNGLQPNCSYQDQVAIELEIKDCSLLQSRYFTTADGAALGATKQAAIEGKAHTGFCSVWVNSFLPAYTPTVLNAAGASNCGAGFPAALVYDPVLRPNGIRCTILDHLAPQLGTFVDTDGNTKANRLFDNVGVQYGLKALQAGTITPEEFVRLNEGVGSYSADNVWSGPAAPGAPANRIASVPDGLETAYGAGFVVDGRQLAKVAIIDLRGNQNPAGDIHANWRSWGQRERLDHANGHHDNQVIWASTPGIGVGAALARKAFLTMDTWLAGVESDGSSASLDQKIVANKPSAAHDFCLNTNGATEAQLAAELPLDSESCTVKYQASPRQAAGGPISENILKCSLKPLDFLSADYAGITFDAGQKSALETVFANGVCDWSQPGVEQVRADPWTTFADGPGGRPLGDPPVSNNGCGRPQGHDDCRGNSGSH
jgi:hypothetical protein